MEEKIKIPLISYCTTGIVVFFIIFAVESIYRGSATEALSWIGDFTRQFIFNYILLFFLFGACHFLNRKLRILASFVIALPLLLVALACNIKETIRGEPVLPSDFILGEEAFNMVDFFSNHLITWLVIILLLIFSIIAFLIYKIPNRKNSYQSIKWISIGMLITFLFTFIHETRNEYTFLKNSLNVDYVQWDQKTTYQLNGVVAGLMLNLRFLSIEKPEGYTEKKVNGILEETPNHDVVQDSDKPNIIVIMSEAFWDPTNLENIKFNHDPLPYFHGLQEKESSGDLLVSVFGGSTVNTEFEVLTGLSMQLLPSGAIAYLQYVKNPILSLPFTLKKQGYDTTAIHTWHHWFYNRSNVYKNLGFDKFISLEYMANPIPDPPYIHDRTITDQILEEIDKKEDKPDFIFAVTTQNHGPYSTEGKKAYANIEVEVVGKNQEISREAKNILEVYSDNLTEVDKELQRLISELEARGEKTMVVIFGDHLPLLGDDYQVYRESNYINGDNSYGDYLKIYSTPYVIWDNFTEDKQDYDIDSSLLGPIITERAGLEGNNYYDYLASKVYKGELTKIPRRDYWEHEEINSTLFNNINLLQYDILFGEMYGVNKGIINENSNYRVGNKPKINKVEWGMEQGDKYLSIKGENFSSYCVLYINNEKIEMKEITKNEIKAVYTKNISKIKKVVVEIVDSNNKLLTKSNSFELTK